MTADLLDRPPTPRVRRDPAPARSAVDVVLAATPPINTAWPELAQFTGNPADRLAPEDQQRFVLAVGKLCRRGWQPDQFWREFTREEQARGRSRVETSLRYGVSLSLLPVLADDAETTTRIEAARAELTAAEQAQAEAECRARELHRVETAVTLLRERVQDARNLAGRLPGWLEETEAAIATYVWPEGRQDAPANLTGLYGTKLALRDAIQDAPQQISRLERLLAAKESELAAMTAANAN